MAFAPYKEGQGIWVRGVMATTVFLVAMYSALRLNDWLLVEAPGGLFGVFAGKKVEILFGWTLDLRLVPVAVLLIGFLGVGVWAYNYPRFVDFLVETENELKTRVTWPTRKELFSASTVVVLAVIMIAVWVLVSDWFFIVVLRQFIYRKLY